MNDHPVTLYAKQVTTGEIVAGKLVKLACERHLRDLKYGQERGLRFNEEAANHAFGIFDFLHHTKGRWAAKREPIRLELWQRFVIGSVFGWQRWDDEEGVWLRRYTEAHVEIGRKNGKSTLGAGVGLYLLIGDGEEGPEVYAAATKQDQAKIVWDEAKHQVERSHDLRLLCKTVNDTIVCRANNGKFKAIGADSKKADGFNVHGAIIDELHAHKNGDLYAVIKGGRGSRLQPLIFVITTSGLDQASFGYERRKYCEQILNGVVEADDVFPYIAAIDEEDDWTNPDVWIKANPNLGVSIRRSELEAACRDAQVVLYEQNEFIAKRCNRYTTNVSRWMPMDKWDLCNGEIDLAALNGRTCFAGIDLSAKDDLTALVLVFPPLNDDDRYIIIPYFWTPAETLTERERRTGVPYSAWVRNGRLLTVDGNVIDNQAIRAKLKELAKSFKIQEVAYDDWNASELALQLQNDDGFTVVPFGQTVKMFSEPTKKLMHLVLDGRINHGNNDILRWMAGNVVVYADSNNNIRPAKDKSDGKIDGIVAAIMALDRAMRQKKRYNPFGDAEAWK